MKTTLFKRCCHLFAAGVLILFATAMPGWTQSGATATLSGTVTDPIGSVVPNAVVTAHSETTGASHRATADAQGRFIFTGLPVAKYTVEATAAGFAPIRRTGLQLTSDTPQDISLALSLGNISQQVTVEAENANSVAAQLAPMDSLLDAHTARTEITPTFIQNFTSPVSDFGELVNYAPGTFSTSANGVGLGQSKTYFRGFPDGDYDITFDGIPFNDTNSPTHHSWAFFPSQWVGGIDFDRSPGSASTLGPTPFGGSINLLSKDMSPDQNIRGGVSYGSFNTLLVDGEYDSGNFGGRSKKSNLLIDVHHMTSDGYQTFNYQTRNAGSLKYQYKFSEKSVLTGFSGVLILDSNTPDFGGPTAAQVAQYGKNFLMNNDPTSPYYYRYSFYHVPTDFEYVGYRSELGHGWILDTKPYTYSYYNKQNLTKPGSKVTVINDATCATSKLPCGVDKLNSYRKYGEITSLSQHSKYGVFRTGLWYEWATTNRYQYPTDPRTWVDATLPNFHEQFWTNSYQPFAEYEWHATSKLTLTGGFKYAYYTMDLKQFADNGKTVGNLGGAPYTRRNGGFSSYLPSFDANYRLKPNWSVYGQFATGSIIPPSSVFDFTGQQVAQLPKPTTAKTYQGGTVLKLHRISLNADGYYTHYQGSYASYPDASNDPIYYLAGDQATKGFEGEGNIYIAHGLSFYINGTVGSAHYVSQNINQPVNGVLTPTPNPNYQRWVASTPANTQTYGLTWQQRYFDVGFLDKRIGPMWNDNGSINQAVPIAPFNTANLFANYTVRNGGRFDQTKFRLSFNNIFNQQNLYSLTPANAGTIANPYTPSGSDIVNYMPARSVMLTVTFGYSPKR